MVDPSRDLPILILWMHWILGTKVIGTIRTTTMMMSRKHVMIHGGLMNHLTIQVILLGKLGRTIRSLMVSQHHMHMKQKKAKIITERARRK